MSKVTIKLTTNYFEKQAWDQGLYACGLDEVGRGCLAGPVVVGAAIIPINANYKLLKDSKVLTADERTTAFNWINAHCWWTVAIASHRIVDSINIYQTTLLHMKKAYQQLIEQAPIPLEKIKFVLVDAMPLEIHANYSHQNLECFHFNKGEQYSTSIAAASIVAKVTRDRIMDEMAPYFPAFGFGAHKGYATQQHVDALKNQGATVIHRLSFLSNIGKEKPEQQETLF